MYSFQTKLETVKVLGKGGFGNVILVKREFDKKLLAVKVRLKHVLKYSREKLKIRSRFLTFAGN